MARRKIPFQTVSWAAANPSTTPRIGPTHGVHPKAKANPITNAPQADELPLRLCSRVSASRALICRMPVKWRLKRIMTPRAMGASSDLYCARTWPTSVEIAPSVMKTMLKPMMKAAELSITLRKSSPSFSFSCSTPTPEIRETYPGTSGSTQGDKNEISPATKAASGNGKLVISLYCSDRGEVFTPYKMLWKVELLQHFRLRPIGAFIWLPSSRRGLLWLLRAGRRPGWRSGRGWCHGLGSSFGQNLLDESWRHGGGENRAISGLFDFEAVEERLYICIRTVRADAAFGGVKEAEKGGGLLGDGLRVSLTVGERFRPQVESGEISSRNHGDRRLRKQEAPTAQPAQGTHFGGFHAQNRKRQTCQGKVSVEILQQPGAAKRRGQFPGAVEHAANHVGVRMVRNRDAVIRKNDNAHRAAFEGDVVDIKTAVIVN